MKLISCLLVVVIALLCYQCNILQYEDTSEGINYRAGSYNTGKVEDGRCYGKCLMPDSYETYTEEYIAYTGNALKEDVDVEVVEIELRPESSRWIRKKADGNCMSADPEDCLVWCLVEVPAITREVTVLLDTTQSKHYTIERIEHTDMVEKGGYTAWTEVLCMEEITEVLVGQIQNALKEKGYYDEVNTLQFDVKTKASLMRFQKENNLPVGQLDFETLEALEVALY